VQFLVYRTDTKEWKLIPDAFDDKSAKSGLIYMASDGTIWADLAFSGSSYFAIYNDEEGQFEYVVESENIPVGNLLSGDDGKFWILASKDGIYSYDTLSHKIEKHVSIPDLETSGSLYGSMATLAPDGSIYFLNMAGERQVRLMHFFPKTGQLEYAPDFDFYLGDISYNLFMERSGRLWVGDLGWMEPDGAWYRIVRSPVFITDRAESSVKYIWSSPSIVLESSNDLLWFRSDNGLTWLDPQEGEWCWFTTEQSNIVEDQQHNLWMIADGKLYKYPLIP
jgi:ligand-binding sensor domain-containing protein